MEQYFEGPGYKDGSVQRRKNKHGQSKDNGRSLVRLFQEESRKLDQVLDSYDAFFKASEVQSSQLEGRSYDRDEKSKL